ncbi:hypothetical protein [uncultured Fenollaria sp.]|uniref:hypothetical protein n=1 Tax=uncultured Fenollaria sp. TaxID=1686315 RepID=UPI0025F906E2|nr:hypothetical protein [uncultured Fenollaria sp.]
MDKIKQIIEYIKANIDEIRKLDDQVSYGTLLGYLETLSIIKSVYDEEQWVELGLNFDEDEEYL